MRKVTEAQIQRAFFQYVRAKANLDDRYSMIAAIPNGAHLARGAITYNNLASQGLSPGYPDVTVDLPTDKYHGLKIEFKTESGKQSESQKRWETMLIRHGYLYLIVRSLEHAIAVVEEWMRENSKSSRR